MVTAFDEIGRIIGRSGRSCYQKYRKMKLPSKTHIVRVKDISNETPTIGQQIPEVFHIDRLVGDFTFNNFDEAINHYQVGFHVTQIPPTKMILFNRDDFVDNYLQGMNLTTDQKVLFQELDDNPITLNTMLKTEE
jgi:hypothetical protein